MREHEERRTHARFLCKVSLSLKLLTFLFATALQRFAKMGVRRVEEDVGPHTWLDAPNQFPELKTA